VKITSSEKHNDEYGSSGQDKSVIYLHGMSLTVGIHPFDKTTGREQYKRERRYRGDDWYLSSL